MRAYRSILPLLALCLLSAGSLGGQSLPPVAAVAPTAGPESAPVTAIVFSDFACPFSAQLSYVLDRLEKRYPAQLRVVFRQSPLSIHPDAPLAHRAALAAGRQGRYAEMSNLLYGNQAHQDASFVTAYARQLHLDLPRFRRDMNSPAVAARLAADMEESRGLAVQSTPTVYINGRALVGFQTEEILARTVGDALRQADPSAQTVAWDDQPTLDKDLQAQLASNPTAARGTEDAPLTIVEFTDFQCPFCKSAVDPMKQLLAERGRNIRWVFRAFPLDFHPDAQLAAEAALAAGAQGKFWEMHDQLFGHQNALKQADLLKYAAEIGLDVARFTRDLETHTFAGQVAADRALGSRAGVNGTPTFFIDGHAMSGVRSLPELRQITDSHLPPEPGDTRQTAAIVKPEQLPARTVSGTNDAPLTLTWYTDVRGATAVHQGELVRALADRYGKRLQVLYRSFPLEAYPDAALAAQALLAAQAQGRFWPMYDLLTQHPQALDRPAVIKLAETMGLDMVNFGFVLDTAHAEVLANRDEAERRGIRGAPVVFVNTKRVDGLQSLKLYVDLVDTEMAQAPIIQASRQVVP